MDRSFLSDPAVVAATRGFVCVRAATYENEEEVPFLTGLFRGRSPELENTVFALLAPDGQTRISNGGRSPQMAFRTDDNTQMINRLKAVSANYEVRDPEAPDRLPVATSLRLALNVAACDNQPLAICLADTPKELRSIGKAVAREAWSAPLLGQFHYVYSSKREAAEVIGGLEVSTGLVVVQPDEFGTGGKVIASHGTGDASHTIRETLEGALQAFDRPAAGSTMEHVREGRRSGVHWETATPVTDSHAKRGRE